MYGYFIFYIRNVKRMNTNSENNSYLMSHFQNAIQKTNNQRVYWIPIQYLKALSDVICQTTTHPNECPTGENHLAEMQMTSGWVHYLLLGHAKQAVKYKIFQDLAETDTVVWHSLVLAPGREHQITFKLDSFRFRCKCGASLVQNNVISIRVWSVLWVRLIDWDGTLIFFHKWVICKKISLGYTPTSGTPL